jgi:hypothetical protein
MIRAAHGKNSKALATLELTERLSDARLSALTRELHGSDARDALRQIADQSEFLPPPASGVPADPPPDPAAQQQILASAAEYLDHILPKLPIFFCNAKCHSLWRDREVHRQDDHWSCASSS